MLEKQLFPSSCDHYANGLHQIRAHRFRNRETRRRSFRLDFVFQMDACKKPKKINKKTTKIFMSPIVSDMFRKQHSTCL